MKNHFFSTEHTVHCLWKANAGTNRKAVYSPMRSILFVWLLCFAIIPKAFSIGGSGTEQSPYTISNKADLDQVRAWVNAGTNIDKYYKLTADIDLGGGRFDPIGNSTVGSFWGVFDGDNHTISNFYIDRSDDYVGFFGVTVNATIKNLKLNMLYVNGKSFVGSLIGETRRNITLYNCHVTTTETCNRRGSYQGGFIGRCLKYDSGTNISIEFCSYVGTTLALLDGGNELMSGGFIGSIDKSFSNVIFKDCLVKTNITNAAVLNDRPNLGGFIGYIESAATFIRCVAYCEVPNCTSTNKRGSFWGDIYNVGTYSLKGVYYKESESGIPSNFDRRYCFTIPSWTANQVYTQLERSSDAGAIISATTPSNYRWRWNSGGWPELSDTGYEVMVTKSSGIGSITSLHGNEGTSYFTPANEEMTVTSNPAPLAHQRAIYSFTPYYPSLPPGGSHTATMSGNDWKLKPRVIGKVSASIENIPYPISPVGNFNQWTKEILLTWTYNNPQNLTGKFYIYYRDTTSTEKVWTLDNNSIDVVNGTGNLRKTYTLTSNDFGKVLEYCVAFIEGTGAAPSTPPNAGNQETIPISTVPTLGNWSVTTEANTDNIVVSFTTDKRFTNSNDYKYSIQRSVNGAAYTDWLLNQNFIDDSTRYTHINGDLTSPCDSYRYRVVITAFNTTFSNLSEETHITGNTKFVAIDPFKASKGEYANYVRLQWKVDRKQGGSNETYRIFRRVANTVVYTELETITSNAATVYWNDNNALTGVFYEYKVVLYQTCFENEAELASCTNIGFTQAFGIVSGRVTYGTGSSVQDVNMLVRRNDLQNGESQYHSLKSTGGGQKVEWLADQTYFNDVWTSKQWTLQFWINPEATNKLTTIIGYLGGYAISMTETTDGYQIHTDLATAYKSEIIPTNHYSHITITRDNNTVKIYTACDQNPNSIYFKDTSFTYSTATTQSASDSKISFGHDLKGNIDDVRFWNRSLNEAEIKRDYNRVLIGNESGLKIYWTFDDALSNYAFDMSRMGTVYNGNHATTNTLVSDTNVPDETYQLALKGITDKDGNYQIGGIPYMGEGTSYSVVPSMGVHVFNPTQQLRYISPTSMVHNATDFTDESSFKLSGKIVYEGGNYPVEDCHFEVDGRTLVESNGSVITNKSDGGFTIDVPIGIHEVRVVKQGHTFLDDGKILNATGDNLNYNNDLTLQAPVQDKTLVKVIGRVAGGLKENEKVLGFGESKNNIGAQTITLTPVLEQYDLKSTDVSKTYLHNEGKWKKITSVQEDTTRVTLKAKSATVNISPETGEFVALLPPIAYYIENIRAQGYDDDIYNAREVLDLTKTPVPDDSYMQQSVRQWTDSVDAVLRPGELPHKTAVEKSDTILYHAKWQCYYQAVPTFSMVQLEGDTKLPYLGDKKYTYVDSDAGTSEDISLVSINETTQAVTYTFDKPVFTQGTDYKFELSAFEVYKNNVKNVNDTAFVSGGTINITNGLPYPTSSEPVELTLDSLGKGIYEFMAGVPDLTTGIKTFFATLIIGNVGYNWNLGPDPQEVWMLGSMGTGTDFMTAGPDRLEIILRDPPGSRSYAYIEAGTTVSSKHDVTASIGHSFEHSGELKTGGDIVTFVGLGGGTILEAKVTNTMVAGVATEEKFNYGFSTESKTTYTERFETSSEPLYVGHNGDVFVGNSTNILYGLANSIKIKKGSSTDFGNTQATINGSTFSIGKATSLAIGEKFATRFAYTQIGLEQITIPTWKSNLALILKAKGTVVNPALIDYPVYVSNLETTDPNFGKINGDDVFGANGSGFRSTDDGPSYTIVYPDGFRTNKEKTKNFQDSVIFYNNQINMWEAVLRKNEEEKVKMHQLGNYSFGSGAKVEYSKTSSSITTNTVDFNFVINGWYGNEIGGEVSGIGAKILEKNTVTIEAGYSYTDGKETTGSVGFVLQEEGDDDQISVDYGFYETTVTDILSGKLSGGTFIFKTQGGRTSCPYEGAYVTKYYEPGKHTLSNATMQIEVPKISVSSAPEVINVPSNKTASFILDLKNESETDEDVWFQLIVDEQTNPDGAELKIDGQAIGNGRLFLVKAGQVLQKTLTVGKGPAKEVYENIGLILRSQCQHDPTDFLENIGDTAYVSVRFIPGSSDVTINKPANSWITNTESGDSIQIVLQDFDINFANFGYVGLEYRSKSTNTWSSIMKFYGKQSLYDSATGNKMLLTSSDKAISYWWNQKDMVDGAYELRTYTTCLDNLGNELSRYTTDAVTGIKDMKKPQPLGNPSPANGVLNIGDEISILFNEDIRQGMVTDNQISIKGVMNGTIIAEPNVGLNFSSTGYAYTEMPIVTGGSFSIESWFKRTPGSAGTLFAFGANSNYISIGFNATGNAVLKLGENTFTSSSSINNTDEWKYISLIYDASKTTVSAYVLEGTSTTVLFGAQDVASATQPEKQGRLYLGSMPDKSNAFNGALSGVHFWNKVRAIVDIAIDKNTLKTGQENGLLGYWSLDEGKGSIATDKARSRHLTLETNWYIYPQGKSAKVSANTYLSMQSGTFPFSPYDDFSVEFWFKGADQASATLFSAGHGVKDEFTNGKLSIAVNENKQLVLRSKGQENVITENKVLDNQWHHFALTVKRNGMSSVYIDGTLAGQINSELIGGLESANYNFGACVYSYLNGGVKTNAVNEYFTGYFDDIRVWNSVLSKDLLTLNMNHKLGDNEVGLLAYYPFDKYESGGTGVLSISPSSLDFVTESLTITGFTADADVPAIIDCRPTEIIAYPSFNYVTSNNKIVINIDDSYRQRIEGVVLEVSVKDIYDLQNNKSDVQKWSVFVNQNALMWQEDGIDLVMEEGTDEKFTATIVNKSGENTDYILENIPDWLSVNSNQGTLKPTASKVLTFTVSKGVNIGSYEALIALTGANGISERLPVSLKVTGKRPDWSVNPSDFALSMSIYGSVQIEGAPQEDEGDILAAFIGDLCVGVASPIYVKTHNAYSVFMSVYGNPEHEEKPVEFRLWDASTGRIYPEILTSQNGTNVSIAFESGETRYAKTNNPVIFNAENVIEQQIPLVAGWNWFSVNVENMNPDLLTQFKDRISVNANEIKSYTSYLEPIPSGNQVSWIGTLSDLLVKETYLTNLKQSQALKMKGSPVDVSETEIPLNLGWNWIGYTPQLTTTTANALAGINAKDGDQIKSQTEFSIYDENTGWFGTLNYMQPGRGYMYYSENNQAVTFHYPNVTSMLRSSIAVEAESEDMYWENNYHRFANNMTVTSIAFLEKDIMESELIEIAAFAGDDCRGNIMLSYQDLEILPYKYLGFLMVYGESGDQITFRMYDHSTGEEYVGTNDPLSFKANNRNGSALTPYPLKFTKAGTSIDKVEKNGISIYPNPVTTILNIKHNWNQIDRLEVVDVSGRMIMVRNDFKDKSLNVSDLADGLYLLKLMYNGETVVLKFNKK